jgi:glycosyltransferase involved in cell wall biosynthesis
VDVVISLYNKAGLVNRAVRSVLQQTRLDWRLTIVDDGSSDGWRFDDDISAEGILVVRQENAGPGAARNNGAAAGTAPFLAFLDADDEWEPEYLERMLSLLEADASLGAVTCTWSGDRSATADNANSLGQALSEGRWSFSPSISPAAFKGRVDSIHSSATVVRRDAFEQLGGFYEKRSTYGEDSFLWAALALTKPIYRVDEPLLRFHTDGSTLSVGRRSAYPLPPMIVDWRSFKERVEGMWAPFMPAYLAYYSRFVLERSVRQGATEQVSDLLGSGFLRDVGLAYGTRLSIRAGVLRTRVRVNARNLTRLLKRARRRVA